MNGTIVGFKVSKSGKFANVSIVKDSTDGYCGNEVEKITLFENHVDLINPQVIGMPILVTYEPDYKGIARITGITIDYNVKEPKK